MSARALTRAAFAPRAVCGLTAYRVLVLAAHISDAGTDGADYARLDRAWMARVLECSTPSIHRGVRELVTAGMLVKASAPRGASGRWETSVYVVLPEVPARGHSSV